MDYGFGNGTLAGVLILAAGIIAVILGVMWMFLPWLLMAKMDRMIELLEELVKGKKS